MTGGGMATIYLHGQPGSADELALFGAHVARNTSDWHVLDRTPPSTGQSGHHALLAMRARRFAAGRPIRLIGFSMGGWEALHLAAHMGGEICGIDLIACAVQPRGGLYPRDMVGKPVFELSRDHPILFGWLTRMQGWGAMVAPALIRRVLFAKAQGGDVALMTQPAFRKGITHILRSSLSGDPAAYLHDIAEFVAGPPPDWSTITAPVTLWHGEADNWAPIKLAEQLAVRLPTLVDFHRLPDLSHYSTLGHVLATMDA
jgi:pimeloyl-ACP methyl ester carboxylesterase